jgi:dihydropteroate synthase
MQDLLANVRPASGPELAATGLALQSMRAPLLMGIVNLTPDSFYDGGRHLDPNAARLRIDAMLERGADLLDLGAESSRPGSHPVPAAEQIRRLEPALGHALAVGARVSVDTTSPEVAQFALGRGAQIVNDVSCLRDAELARVCAAHGAWLVIMHSRRPMAEMTGFSQWPDDAYADIVQDVRRDWGLAAERAVQAGMAPSKLIFDPGFGFSKNARHSYELLARLSEFRSLGVPILSGPSRKSFLASVDGSPPEARLGGTIAACLASARAGADVLRVHDVHEVRQALAVWSRAEAAADDSSRLSFRARPAAAEDGS